MSNNNNNNNNSNIFVLSKNFQCSLTSINKLIQNIYIFYRFCLCVLRLN